jgi:colanic acid biosynthesis glycosyl transferase WcaI
MTFFLSTLLIGPFLCGGTDVVYVWGNPPTSGLAGWVIARLRGARFVYGVHDLWPEVAVESSMVRNAFVVRILDALERFILNRADLVLPISHGFKHKILEKGVAEEKVHVLPHWADETLYKPLPNDPCLAAKLGVTDCFVLLYAGNLGRLQGLDNLIEAVGMLQEEIPMLRVILAGDGVERDRLQRLAAERRIKNAVFIGPQTSQEVVAYSGLANVLYVGLVDSQLALLSIPSKVATYMACGRPILSAVPGETAMLIKRGQCGINCENTPQGIAGGIRRMAALSEQERLLMGQRAQEIFAREFAMSSLLMQHETLMQHIVNHVYEAT